MGKRADEADNALPARIIFWQTFRTCRMRKRQSMLAGLLVVLFCWFAPSIRSRLCEPGYLIEPGGMLWGSEHDALLLLIFDAYSPAVGGSVLACGRRPESLVVDVGVNTGAITLRAAQHGARVIGFEAIPSNAETLNQRVSLNHYQDRVRILNVAAGDVSAGSVYASDNYYERVDFWGTVSWQKNGMVIAQSDVAEATKAGQTVTTVPIRRIVDEVASLQEQKWISPEQRILLFKVDVEGFEHRVITGAEDMFTNRRVEIVHSEFSPAAMNKWSKDAAVSYLERFGKWGYRILVEDCSHNIDEKTIGNLATQMSLRCATASNRDLLALVHACKNHEFDAVLPFEVRDPRKLVEVLTAGSAMVNLIMC